MPMQQLQPKSGFASACLPDFFWTLENPDERLAGRTWEITFWMPTAHNILPLLSQWLQIVRDLVYKLGPDCLLLNAFAAFSTFPGTVFLKHFCSVSASLYFSPFSLLHFTWVLSEPSGFFTLQSPHPCSYSVFVSFSFLCTLPGYILCFSE